MTILSTDHTPGVKRLHVLRGAHDTAVVFSQYPSITAAAKRQVIAVACRSGLAGPINLIATCPIQSPQTLRELGLEPLQPLIAVPELTAAQRLRKAAERVIACWEQGDLADAVRKLVTALTASTSELRGSELTLDQAHAP